MEYPQSISKIDTFLLECFCSLKRLKFYSLSSFVWKYPWIKRWVRHKFHTYLINLESLFNFNSEISCRIERYISTNISLIVISFIGMKYTLRVWYFRQLYHIFIIVSIFNIFHVFRAIQVLQHELFSIFYWIF